jgi:2-polyprenyl-3-methyl-5-hydroxy-6-metoxy-1,4-benzoquinol methylase
MDKIRSCHCCGSSDLKIKFKGMTDQSYFIPGKFNLLECTNCKMAFTDPLQTEEESGKYYPADQYYSYKNKNKLALLYHRMCAYFYSHRNPVFTALLYPFKPLFYTYFINPGKSLLEIGCGDGLKLKIYKSYNMKVFGLEPYGPKLSEEEKKLNITKKSVKDAPYKSNSFDYIIMKEVLEHVPNQTLVLKKSYDWLKPNGTLAITVPNTASIWCKLFKTNWFGYDITRHPYHYNPKSIYMFLKKLGFKQIKIRPYDPPYMLAGSLKYYFNNPLWLHNFFKLFFTPLTLITSYLRTGSLMEIVCKK